MYLKKSSYLFRKKEVDHMLDLVSDLNTDYGGTGTWVDKEIVNLIKFRDECLAQEKSFLEALGYKSMKAFNNAI